MFPICLFSQTISIGLGPSLSLLKAPHPAKNGISNAVLGFSGAVGLDFAQMKSTFFSGGLGLLQKGRRGDVTLYDDFNTQKRKASLNTMYTYGTASLTFNYKLKDEGLIPFVTVGPGIEFLLSQKQEEFESTALGIEADFGLMKELDHVEIGGRLDYLASFGKEPKSVAGAVLFFVGFKIGEH